ncbi:hypothetical protein LguiA_030010 [Lonicera macranthoides]
MELPSLLLKAPFFFILQESKDFKNKNYLTKSPTDSIFAFSTSLSSSISASIYKYTTCVSSSKENIIPVC